MRKRTPLTSVPVTAGEVSAACGIPTWQISDWADDEPDAILQTYKLPQGAGTRRLFSAPIVYLDATEARDLKAAGLTRQQIKRRFAVQRARLAGLAEDTAIVERYRLFIATIVLLADTFGRGAGYDAWLAAQQAELHRMEQTLAAGAEQPDPDHAVLNLLAGKRRGQAPKALAG